MLSQTILVLVDLVIRVWLSGPPIDAGVGVGLGFSFYCFFIVFWRMKTKTLSFNV